jgi:hypothetical protein
MATVQDNHRELAHQVYMMGEIHGRKELEKAIAQAIADAEERGGKWQEESRAIVEAMMNGSLPLDEGDNAKV